MYTGVSGIICYVFIPLAALVNGTPSISTDGYDLLAPYEHHHGPRHSNRYVRECQHVKYNNVTHEMHKASTNITQTRFDHKHFILDIAERSVYGRISHVLNPIRQVTVIQAGGDGGCQKGYRETVEHTVQLQNCALAINAGFYNTSNGQCLGNIVSNGRVIQDTHGIQNAHFGITKDGRLFTGYISDDIVLEDMFDQLVGGVIWLVRNGLPYVNESVKAECSDTQETGTLNRFAYVVAARTAVGHNRYGQVVMITVDGQTDQRGVSLFEFAEMLVTKFDVVNAINLDGGGSTTFVVNGTTSNYPSDKCGPLYRCPRAVSTIICIRPLENNETLPWKLDSLWIGIIVLLLFITISLIINIVLFVKHCRS